MALTRRGMFGAIGGAAVGGKRAIGKVVASATGNPMPGPLFGNGGHVGYPEAGGTEQSATMSILDIQRRLGYWPEWWLEQQRRRAKDAARYSGIDDDIDVMKSVSRVAKRHMQAERNYQMAIAAPEQTDLTRSAKKAVMKSFGIDWIVDE